MKKLIVLMITIGLFCCGSNAFGQTPMTKEQAEAMAQRMRTMTPAQLQQMQKDLTKQLVGQQAARLPNGDQLQKENHYEIKYTTVQFSYKKTVSSVGNGGSGNDVIECSGMSVKAPMQYDAKGYANVKCNMVAMSSGIAAMDQMVTDINNDKKYMQPGQAVQATDNSRDIAFASMTAKDNSLHGTASLSGQHSSSIGHSIITTKPPAQNISFSFTYDPDQDFATIGIGAQIITHIEGSASGGTINRDEAADVGVAARTDPRLAKLGGVGPMAPNPGEVFITVSKTATVYTIVYSKTSHNDASHTSTSESLTATVSGVAEQYEAVIMPTEDSKYEKWLPKGPKVDGSDDTKGDDSLHFYVIVRNKNNPEKRYPGNFTVEYKLSDVTHYKGFNSNYPVTGATQENDFKIAGANVTPPYDVFDRSTFTDSTITSRKDKGALAIVQLTCMDYGAWAKLSVKVTLDNGSAPLTASPYYNNADLFITVPYDTDKNKIADYWEKHENIFGRGYQLDWDEDVKPDNHHNGDNIPLIDEYRGFLTEDGNYKPVYTRFSPQVKELITIAIADNGGVNGAYKDAIRTGAQGYGKASQVKVYHLTNSKYGKREAGEPADVPYGRWVNYNSPLDIFTRGVTIFAHAEANPDHDPDVALAIATTFPVGGAPHADVGAMLPEETKGISIWVKNIIDGSYKPEEYLPLNGHPDDPKVIRKNGYITQANAEFHQNIDPLHMSDIVAQYHDVNIGRIISFAISHELCHATNIHHHHVTAHEDNPFFQGVSTCPVRYWMNNKVPVNGCTWVVMFITGKWNPATLTTPWGPGDQMRLCTVGDNCFSQLQLKKN